MDNIKESLQNTNITVNRMPNSKYSNKLNDLLNGVSLTKN